MRRPSAPGAPSGGIDGILLVAVLALCGLGVVMVYSSSAVFASHRLSDPTYFLRRQAVAAVLGLVALAACASLPPERLRPLAPTALLFALLALALVFVPGVGRSAGGATRWVRLGPLGFQPSELAKPALVLYLAWSLSRKGEQVRQFKAGFLGPVLVAGTPILLVLQQPDLGTAVTLAAAVGLLLFVAGVRLRYLLGAAGAGALAVAWLIYSTPWRMRRIVAFLDPWAVRHDEGYQVAESLISIGSGGLTGVGLGEGRQKLFFLPEAHTDFIFSIVGEELGLIGTTAVILLFAVFLWRGVRAAFRAEDAFGAFLALGLTFVLGLQAFLNMAVTMGLLPTKGLPLPFVSYGGTSLVLSMAAAGILLSIGRGQGGFLARHLGARR
ncbi:MAG: putative lipid II flippase FtsW [Deltaproteobacteria bacterium]|nr:MAG: putative lipid II flippase FtsW [Deltaproteobacteria bacterium]